MAFPAGWTRQCPLVIQGTQVPANQTAFPVLVTAASLPNEMVTLGGGNAAQSDGGDIRFSSDLTGASQLACEVVAWTQNAVPASAVAEIWVPVNVTTSNVTIYVWYKAGGGLTQPAANAAFGSQAVWPTAAYNAVYHLNEATNAQALDSTANAANSTVNVATQITGKIGNGQSFTLASSQSLAIPGQQPFGPKSCTVWFKGTLGFTIWDPRRNDGFGIVLYADGTDHKVHINTTNGGSQNVASTATVNDGAWHYCAFTETGGTGVVYVDSNAGVSGSWTADNGGSTAGKVAKDFTGGFGTGNVDELRIVNRALSAPWIATEYNNQNSPGAFLIAGTPTAVGGGGGGGTPLHHLQCAVCGFCLDVADMSIATSLAAKHQAGWLPRNAHVVTIS